jgi:hypothetical protein
MVKAIKLCSVISHKILAFANVAAQSGYVFIYYFCGTIFNELRLHNAFIKP